MIDVAISSCGRIDILENAIVSFKKYAHCKEGFRLIVCEDKVDDKIRQENGRKWIEEHSEWFDQIIYSNQKLTYVYCFSEIMKYINSPFFFRLEDDVEFIKDIDVDLIIEELKNNNDTSQVIFRRENHPLINPTPIENNSNLDWWNVDFFSIATGVFNLNLTKKIVNKSGTGQCHETTILTPSMMELDLKSSVLNDNGSNILHYLGDYEGYKKGKWKKIK